MAQGVEELARVERASTQLCQTVLGGALEPVLTEMLRCRTNLGMLQGGLVCFR